MNKARQIPVTTKEQCPGEQCLSQNVSPTGVVSGSGVRKPGSEDMPYITHFGYRCNDCGLVFTVFKG